MSRSNPTATSSPVTRYYNWKGSIGKFVYWDRELSAEKVVEKPFQFAVLDTLSCVTGYNEKEGTRYFSNEVRNLSKEEIEVRTRNGVEQRGLYRDLTMVRSKGAKFATNIYAMLNGEVVVIQVSGSSLSPWIEHKNNNDIYKGMVQWDGETEEKKGATTYYAPTFKQIDISKADDEKAKELDKQLQQFFRDRTDDVTEYGREESAGAFTPPADDTADIVLEDIDENEEVDLSEIPF